MLKYKGERLTSIKGLSLTELMSLQKELSILIGKVAFFKEYGHFPEGPKTALEFEIEKFKALSKEEQQEVFNKLQYLYQLIDLVAVQYSNLARTIESVNETLTLVSPPVTITNRKTA